MQRRRFAQLAAVATLGVAAPAFWMASPDAEQPLFQRFVVAPGADPSSGPLVIVNAQLIEVDRTGTLLVHTGTRVRRQQRPRAYQDIDGRRHEVSVHFAIAAAGEPRLVVGPYDRTFPLVIDPEIGKDALQP